MIEVLLVEFDSMENDLGRAVEKNVVSRFINDNSGDAVEKCDIFLSNYKINRFYRGWDRKVYPYLEIKHVDDPL